jgi:hypothetical protein
MKGWMSVAALAACLGAGAFATAQDEAKAPAETVLTARKLDKAPELKAELDETWQGAVPVTLATKHSAGKPGPDVELRALHDGEHIYLMARWEDDSKSDTKNAWEWKDGAWSRLGGDEDRFSVAINNNVEGFATRGCATLCHDGSMTTNVEGKTADLWHWKAARGGQHGWSDDQNFNGEPEGRVDDGGTSAYSTNADGEAPKWVWKEDADMDGPFNAETAREVPEGFKPPEGYRVPSVLLRDPEGSRADVEAASKYEDGWWTVVLKRKLDTGRPDDTSFKVGESRHIAVAVFNNTGAKTGKEHAKSGPVKLALE